MSATAPQALTAAERIHIIVEGISAIVAHHASANHALGLFAILLCNYLSRTRLRLHRLLARWQAGRLAPPRAPRPSAPRASTTSRPKLPRRRAWLIRLIQPTAQFGPPLEILLATPEITALLAEAPQIRRLLRPLANMLGLRVLPPQLQSPPKNTSTAKSPPRLQASMPQRQPPAATPPPACTPPAAPSPFSRA